MENLNKLKSVQIPLCCLENDEWYKVISVMIDYFICPNSCLALSKDKEEIFLIDEHPKLLRYIKSLPAKATKYVKQKDKIFHVVCN